MYLHVFPCSRGPWTDPGPVRLLESWGVWALSISLESAWTPISWETWRTSDRPVIRISIILALLRAQRCLISPLTVERLKLYPQNEQTVMRLVSRDGYRQCQMYTSAFTARWDWTIKGKHWSDDASTWKVIIHQYFLEMYYVMHQDKVYHSYMKVLFIRNIKMC